MTKQDDFLNMTAFSSERSAGALLACNSVSAKYGLRLNREDTVMLVIRRNDALKESGRVEFGESIFRPLIEAFCDSPYLSQKNYAETLAQLTEAFYHLKNATGDRLSDDELIQSMKKLFDGFCGGEVQAVLDLDAETLIAMNNREPEYFEEAEEED